MYCIFLFVFTHTVESQVYKAFIFFFYAKKFLEKEFKKMKRKAHTCEHQLYGHLLKEEKLIHVNINYMAICKFTHMSLPHSYEAFKKN